MLRTKKTTEYRRAIMRRALAILLCLSMVVGNAPLLGNVAYAADEVTPVTEEAADVTTDTESTECNDVTHEHSDVTEEASEEPVAEEGAAVEEDAAAEPAALELTTPEVTVETETYDATAEEASDEEGAFIVYESSAEKPTYIFYDDLDKALEYAGSQDAEMTVMLNYGETYMVSKAKGSETVIPSNVTFYVTAGSQLILPFKDGKGVDQTASSGNGEDQTDVAWKNPGTNLNQKMTLEKGAEIVIQKEGKLTVAGLTGSRTQEAPQGQTTGSYSEIYLNDGSNIYVEGDMEVFGRTYGDGQIEIKQGGVLMVPFYIADFGGGTNILEGSKVLFPAQQYGINSLQCPVKLNYGGDISGVAKIYAALEGIGMFASTGMVVIGHGDGIIDMQPGSVVYVNFVENTIQPDIGALDVKVYGNATIGDIQSEIMGIAISSTKKYISIPYNWTLSLYDGYYSIPADMYLKFMPGSKFILNEGATLNLKDGSKCLVYDGFIQSGFGGRFYPSSQVLQNNGYSAAGHFILNGGTLSVDAGATFAGLIQNTGAGQVVTQEGAILNVGYTEEYIDGCDTSNSDTRTSMKLAAKYWDGTEYVDLKAGETLKAYNGANDSLKSFTMDKFQTTYWMEEGGKKNEPAGGYVNYPAAENRTGTWNLLDVQLTNDIESGDGYEVVMQDAEGNPIVGNVIPVDGTLEVVVTVTDGYTVFGDDPTATNAPKVTVVNGTPAAPVYRLLDNGNHQYTYTIGSIKGSMTVTVDGVADTTAPTGTVTIKDKDGVVKSWINQLFEKFADLLHMNYKVNVALTAEDTGSGIDYVGYLVSDAAMSKTALAGQVDAAWTTVTDMSEDIVLTLDETTDLKDIIVYVKLTDYAGHVTYISTDGMRYDAKAPVIAFDGNTLDEDIVLSFYAKDIQKTITVTDGNLVSASYKIGDGDAVDITGGSVNISPLNTYTPYTVTATDKAGNTTTVQFYYVQPLTVKYENTYGRSQTFTYQYGEGLYASENKVPATPATVVRNNKQYVFAGWAVKGTDKVLTADELKALVVEENITFTAVFDTNYLVTIPADETGVYSIEGFTGFDSGTSGYLANGEYTFSLVNADAAKYCSFDVTGATATKDADGNTIYKVVVEDAAVTVKVVANEHVIKEEVTKIPGSCTEGGELTKSCVNCDYKVVEEIAALDHTWSGTPVRIEPTCDTPGSETGYCSVCNATTTEILPALGHQYDDGEYVRETTCTDSGIIQKTCTRVTGTDSEGNDVLCGHTAMFFEKAPGHTYELDEDGEIVYVQETVDTATYDCTEDIYGYAACQNEGCTHEASTVLVYGKAEHNDENAVVKTKGIPATCTASGLTDELVCGNAGCTVVIQKQETIAPLGHQFGEAETTAATCEADGAIVQKCKNCSETYSEIIPATGHDYKITTVRATCTKDGYVYKECQNAGCTSKETTTLEAKGHTYEAVVTAPTCTEDGYTTYTCECGDSYVADETEALTHSWKVAAEVAPTCEADGYVKYTCQNEGCTAVDFDVLEATDHKWGDATVIRAAKCGQVGIQVVECTVCDAFKIEKIDAEDHTELAIPAVEATCTTAGSTAGVKCAACGLILEKPEKVAKLGHNIIVEESKAATCTEDGLIGAEYCSRCNLVVVKEEVVPATGHSYGEWTVTEEATCTTDGAKEKTCAACGDKVTEIIKASGHSWDEGDTVATTCKAEGSVTYTCGTCGEVKTEVLPVAEHDWKDVVVVKEATCTEDGLKKGTCNNCDGQVEYVITASGHKYETAVTDPTCTEKGYTTHECSVCGDTYKDGYTDAAHDVVTDAAVAATCTESGLTEGSHCDACGEVIRAQETVTALGHKYKTTVVAPACTENGYTVYTCLRCGNEYKADTVQASGHSYSDWTVVKEATCTTDGSAIRVCDCGASETKTIEATGHTPEVVEAVAATCDKGGLTAGTVCADCGKVMKAQTATAALGHEYEAAVVAATCTTDGCTVHTCTRCGDEFTDSIVPALGHAFREVAVLKASTCTAEGIAKEVCDTCGAVQNNAIAMLDHAPQIVPAVEATCTKTGLTEGVVCADCGITLVKQETVEKADHVVDCFDGKEPTCTATGYEAYENCRNCDYTTYKELPALGHDYTETVIEATCTEAGQIIKVCKCGDTVTEEGAPAKGHTIVVDPAVAPTATQTGLTEGKHCSDCGAVLVKQTVVPALGEPAHEHTVVTDHAVAPTCTETGLTEGSHCSECGEVIKAQETVPAKGHSYGEEQYQAPTSEADGGWYKVCADCGDKQWTKVQTWAEYVKAGIEATAITATATASVKTETITVKWTKNGNFAVTYYNVYRSKTGKDGSFAKIGTSSTATYTDKTAKPGTKYYYRVRGVRTLDGKNYLTKLSNKPYAKIKKVTAAYVKETKMVIRSYYAGKAIKVTWTSPRIKVDGFEIWRSKSLNGKYTKIKTTKTDARQWTNTGLKLQSRWYYKVRGYKIVDGKKVYTQWSKKGYRYVLNAKNAKLANAIEDANAITAKKATKVSGGIKVTWTKDASVKCNRYEIWRSTSKNGTYTKIATTNNMNYTDKSGKLKSGKRYYYKVVGYRFFGKACPTTKASNVVSAVR